VFSMEGGRGKPLHDAKANRVTNSSRHRSKNFFFSMSCFFKQSIDGPGSFKPVASKIPPQLPTLLQVVKVAQVA
jgi:hypothetical protein